MISDDDARLIFCLFRFLCNLTQSVREVHSFCAFDTHRENAILCHERRERGGVAGKVQQAHACIGYVAQRYPLDYA
jgi:hypothetical protein